MSNKRRADHEPGYVLHTYPYKETSLIVEAFTRSHGRVSVLARGARRPRSAMRGVLLAFHPLSFGWSGAGELATLMAAEWAGALRPLAGQGLMCGFYLNELLLRLLPREDPHEMLYDAYGETLARLSAGDAYFPILRGFEKRLLAELGYALQLEHDAQTGAPIEPERSYVYEPERGPVPAGVRDMSRDMLIKGKTLLDVAADDYGSAETRDEARALMRALIAQRLHGQTLHTRTVLRELNDL